VPRSARKQPMVVRLGGGLRDSQIARTCRRCSAQICSSYLTRRLPPVSLTADLVHPDMARIALASNATFRNLLRLLPER
jgi:hypothetical protein